MDTAAHLDDIAVMVSCYHRLVAVVYTRDIFCTKAVQCLFHINLQVYANIGIPGRMGEKIIIFFIE